MSFFHRSFKEEIPYDREGLKLFGLYEDSFFGASKNNLKLEYYEPKTEDLFLGKEPGFRFWIDVNMTSFNPRKDRKVLRSPNQFTVRKISGELNPGYDGQEIYLLEEESFDTIINFFKLYKTELGNAQYHIKLDDIRREITKDEDKKKHFWVPLYLPESFIARLYSETVPRDEQGNPIQGQRGDVVLNPPLSLQIEMADLSQIDFRIPTLSNTEVQRIDNELKKLYLPQENIDIIKEWLQINHFIKGNYPFKKIANQTGLILYGPAGTGKTFSATEVLKEVFTRTEEDGGLGFSFEEFKISDILGGEKSGYVGGFADGVANKIIGPAIKTIRSTRKPIIVFIDEATELIKDTSSGTSGDSWIREGQEILKNYMNPKRYPGILFVLTTNLEKESAMNDTIIANRLAGIYFDYPNDEKAKDLFRNYFLLRISNGKDVTPKNFTEESPFSDMDLDTAAEELGKLCRESVSVRAIEYFVLEFEKIHRTPLRNGISFNDFRELFIKKVLELLGKDLVKVNEKLAVEEKKYFFEEFKAEKERIEKSIEYLRIVLTGESVDLIVEQRTNRAYHMADVNNLNNEYITFLTDYKYMLNQRYNVTMIAVYSRSKNLVERGKELIEHIENNHSLGKKNRTFDSEINGFEKSQIINTLQELVRKLGELQRINDEGRGELIQQSFLTSYASILNGLPDSLI